MICVCQFICFVACLLAYLLILVCLFWLGMFVLLRCGACLGCNGLFGFGFFFVSVDSVIAYDACYLVSGLGWLFCGLFISGCLLLGLFVSF